MSLEERFENILSAGCSERELRAFVYRLRDEGFHKPEVYDALIRLRDKVIDQKDEDLINDLLADLSGFCGPGNEIPDF